jgi:hypothetical protein
MGLILEEGGSLSFKANVQTEAVAEVLNVSPREAGNRRRREHAQKLVNCLDANIYGVIIYDHIHAEGRE